MCDAVVNEAIFPSDQRELDAVPEQCSWYNTHRAGGCPIPGNT